MDLLPIHRAILSVTDKTGLVEFAKFLVDNGVELVSTPKFSEDASKPCTP